MPTPYSPWGLRIDDKPALTKLDAFTRGAIEVQDEGSQLLALLLDAKRGEMVVDFCAGAGGKTLAVGATMRNTGRLYAFDVSGSPAGCAQAAPGAQRPIERAPGRDRARARRSRQASWRARSTACWWMRRAPAWAPCAATPDLKWRQSPEGGGGTDWPSRRPSWPVQHACSSRAGAWCTPPAASCREENEAIAEAFSAAHPDFELLDAGESCWRSSRSKAPRGCAAGARLAVVICACGPICTRPTASLQPSGPASAEEWLVCTNAGDMTSWRQMG